MRLRELKHEWKEQLWRGGTFGLSHLTIYAGECELSGTACGGDGLRSVSAMSWPILGFCSPVSRSAGEDNDKRGEIMTFIGLTNLSDWQ